MWEYLKKKYKETFLTWPLKQDFVAVFIIRTNKNMDQTIETGIKPSSAAINRNHAIIDIKISEVQIQILIGYLKDIQ